VSVFSVGGEFVRHVGVGVLRHPTGVACSAFDELVVADHGNTRVVVFSASGDVAKVLDTGDVTGVAVHVDAVLAQHYSRQQCVVYE
jgi:hypothetical protein